jgi:hypothetical protein
MIHRIAVSSLLRHVMHLPVFLPKLAPSRTNCAACDAEIPPGRPGRKCPSCRSKPAATEPTIVIEIPDGQTSAS